jgi:chorismate mutase
MLLYRQEERVSEQNPNGNRLIVCRGIRGATTVDDNTAEEILEGTRDLLTRMIAANDIKQEDVASVLFTTSTDLTAEYPALAARHMGWHDAALMCGHEMAVPHGLKRCIRVLILWNTSRTIEEIQHIYIRGAVNLRPDRNSQFNPIPTTQEERGQ